jgi:N-acetylglutamate synthase-like GNAT family acetyltransferase
LIEIRPTTKADCLAFYKSEPPYRIKANTGLLDGEVVAIGGLGFLPDGRVMAFADLTEPAREIQGGLILHRFARRAIADAKASGVKRLIAQKDDSVPAAERWLKRLGFEPLDDDRMLWLWRA